MATPYKTIDVFSDGSYKVKPSPPTSVEWRWVRAPHDIERVNVDVGDFRYRGNVPEYSGDLHGGRVRANVIKAGKRLPEIYRFEPDHHTIADCDVQYMWWGLNSGLNAKRQSSLLDKGLMLMNGGAGLPGHINCLTGEGVNYGTYPRFDQARFMAGAYMLARREGDIAWISSMLKAEPIREAEEVLEHKEWWYWCVSLAPQGTSHLITRPSGVNSDGDPIPVRAPLITTHPVWLKWDELHWMDEDFVPTGKPEDALALF